MQNDTDTLQASDVENEDPFYVDYDPLEYLLIALIDARFPPDKTRPKRLQDAYFALTGKKRERVDEPDSTIAKAMFEYYRRDNENRKNQLKPENGGPVIRGPEDELLYKEKTMHRLAAETADKFSDEDADGNLQDYIYKRARGKYRNSKIEFDPYGYVDSIWDRYYKFDQAKERALFSDLEEMAKILERHGVAMDLSRAFWRLHD